MRKIKSMEDIEKARRRNNIILGVGMILLLVGSSLGYSLMSGSSKNKSGTSELGFDFVRDNGMWKVAVGEDVFGFQNLPSEVEDVDVNVSFDSTIYSEKPLYFVNPGEGVGEILNNIGKYVLRYQEACLDVGNDSDVSCNGDFPIKNCNSNLVVFSPIRDDSGEPDSGDDTRVYSEGNCVFIVGDSMKGSDAFLYEVLGIKK